MWNLKKYANRTTINCWNVFFNEGTKEWTETKILLLVQCWNIRIIILIVLFLYSCVCVCDWWWIFTLLVLLCRSLCLYTLNIMLVCLGVLFSPLLINLSSMSWFGTNWVFLYIWSASFFWNILINVFVTWIDHEAGICQLVGLCKFKIVLD